MRTKRAMRGFIIGSSLPATIWPLAGLGFESRHLQVGTLNWLLIGLFFPLLFGLTNALTVSLPGRKGLAQTRFLPGGCHRSQIDHLRSLPNFRRSCRFAIVLFF